MRTKALHCHHALYRSYGGRCFWELFYYSSSSPLLAFLLTSARKRSLKPPQHWILTFVRFFQAFIYFRGGSQPQVFFNSDIEMTEIVQIGFFLAGLVVSDTMFVSFIQLYLFVLIFYFGLIDLSFMGYLEP